MLSSTKSVTVIMHLKSFFARHGIPEVVISDNGTQFVSQEFQSFARDYGFRTVTTSPRYPQANGEVERMVQTIKRLIIKAKDPYLSLLAYRDTPGPLGKSPAELLMGRRLRTTVPVPPKSLLPQKVSLKKFRDRDVTIRQRQRRYFNSRHRALPLPVLKPGAEVWVTDCKVKARVLRPAQRPRSYVVRTSTGVVLERNRKFLVRFVSQQNDCEEGGGSYEFPQAYDSRVEMEQETNPSKPKAPADPSNTPLPQTSPPGYRTRFGRHVRPPDRYGFND